MREAARRFRFGLARPRPSLADRLRRLHRLSPELRALPDPDLAFAWAEAAVRALVACDEARAGPAGSVADRSRLDPPGALRCRVPIDVATAAHGRAEGGAIEVVRISSHPFSAEDVVLLEQVADLVATSLRAHRDVAPLAAGSSWTEDIIALLGTLSTGVCVLDPSFAVMTANEAVRHMLGLRGTAVAGRPVGELCPALLDIDLAQMALASRDAGPQSWTPFAVGPASLELQVVPMHEEFALLFRDVTRERETEERLRQSQKLESLGRLTGGIAHDVNNMLTVILGNLEELSLRAEARRAAEPSSAAEVGDPAQEISLAESAFVAGEGAAALVSRLVAFARGQTLSPRIVDVGALLASMQTMLVRTIDDAVSLRITSADHLWPALADPAELESALLNLAINAVDAMPSGGRLEIAASNVVVDGVYAALEGLDRRGEYVLIAVTDNGIGMERDVMHRAFDPFFTTKDPGRGTGLGLSMVYGFARQSGGHVTIDSEPSVGTIVRIYLPRSAAAVSATSPLPKSSPGGAETILLVEDNGLVRDHIDAMLRSLGYRVVATRHGPAAVARLREGLRPDLLVTDVSLPEGMNGREVADSCAELIPSLRVLFISGYVGDVLLDRGALPAHVALLNKPFRRTELASRVRAQLGAAPWSDRAANNNEAIEGEHA